jgi:hypothetical protein
MARERRHYGGVVTKNHNMTISAFVVAIIPRRKPAKKAPISGRLLLLIIPHRFEGACSRGVGVLVIGRAYRLLENRKCIRHPGVL